MQPLIYKENTQNITKNIRDMANGEKQAQIRNI